MRVLPFRAVGRALRALTLGAAFTLGACADIYFDVPKVTPGDAEQGAGLRTLQLVKFDKIPGWGGERHADALPALLRSCAVLEKKDPTAALGDDRRMGTIADWIDICREARIIRPGNQVEAKYFFESRFNAYVVGDTGRHQGLFTGYYEPELNGRWAPELGFQIPLYSRPPDIVSVDLGEHRAELAGTHLAGRVIDNRLRPYYTRAEINAGALNGRELEILWVDDAVDAFFLHVQGSGRIRLKDGAHIRVGYAGRNGHRYTSIGRELVALGVMRLEDVTAPSIRAWLKAHPAAARDVMNKNASYVFFRVLEGDGPLGAQGVVLTPGRSLAVDPKYIPLGIPMWIDTTDPANEDAPLRRLVVAQDTGSAIGGPVRGDVFWGFGADAELRAGLMKQPGRYFALLPKAAPSSP